MTPKASWFRFLHIGSSSLILAFSKLTHPFFCLGSFIYDSAFYSYSLMNHKNMLPDTENSSPQFCLDKLWKVWLLCKINTWLTCLPFTFLKYQFNLSGVSPAELKIYRKQNEETIKNN
jgi:hypothetical protein